jgi:hypothetical protein
LSRFEYLSVLISIILALGLSEVLVCWTRLLRHRDVVRFYWVHAMWSVLGLLLIVQFWWGFWQFQVVEDWMFSGLLLVVVQTTTLVVAILLLTPSKEEPPPPSLRDYYFTHSRPVFALAAVLIVLLIVVDVLVGQQPLVHPENAVRPVAAAILAWLAWTRSPFWHAALGVTTAVLFCLFMLVTYVDEGL